ncbi:MAG: AAA family ATPase [Methanomassiliicoccaceae archaeon]|nr:AAA family ATPase [Methanomassiliicoccaceae archaeon]
MKNIYLASVGTRSGKSVLSLGLAMNYPGKVGFYKPFRESLLKVDDEMMDQDAILMAEVLGLEEGKKLSPFIYDVFEPVKMSDIMERYNELCKDKEFMIIEGSREPANGYSHGIAHIDIAKAMNAPMVVVCTTTSQSIDTVAVISDLCAQKGVEMRGVIINKATNSPERRFLQDRGVKVLGEIPMMPELRTFRVSEISEKMDAKVIAGAKGMNNPVETMLVGAMSIQSAIRYLRRAKRKALITGGDRTEILLGALSTDTSCIIVTGGIKPSQTVLSRADEIGVPVLMTNSDTLEVTDIVEHLIARVDPKDKKKIDMIKDNVRHGVDLRAIWGR